MIVRYLLEDDYETWNHFVEQSPQGFIWDYSWWLEIVTDGDYKICALFDDDNLIVAGISLPFFSTGTIRQPLLTQSLGMLYEDMSKRNNMRLQKQLTNQKEYSNQIIDFILNDFKRFSICFNYNYDYWLPLYWKVFKQTTRYTYVIDYSNYVLEEEFKRFSKGHKWVLNKVEKKSDLKVIKVDDSYHLLFLTMFPFVYSLSLYKVYALYHWNRVCPPLDVDTFYLTPLNTLLHHPP